MKIVWKWLMASKPNNLLTIALALIAALASYFGSTSSFSKTIDALKVDINQKIQTVQSLVVYNQPKIGVLAENATDLKEKNSNGFNTSNWIFANDALPNKEGYYCPENVAFPSWFIWSKNKYKADFEVSISFSLMDKTNDKQNPTLYFSYGDKDSDAPDTFYRLNIFDGDLNTIRLYGRTGDSVQFDRSIHEAPLDQFITLKISPVFPNKSSSLLIINPVISYQLDGKEYAFDSKKEFKLALPLSSPNEQGDGFKYGIGVSKGDCFKIIFSNV